MSIHPVFDILENYEKKIYGYENKKSISFNYGKFTRQLVYLKCVKKSRTLIINFLGGS